MQVRPVLERTTGRHDAPIHRIAWSPDGELIASASADQTVRLWSASTGSPVRTLRGHVGPVYCVAFSPDGSLLASGGEDAVRLWRCADGACLRELTGHNRGVWGIAFSPDGSLLASASDDRTVRLWHTDGRRLPGTPLFGTHGDEVWAVAFSPDGFLIASGSVDTKVILWRVPDLHRVCVLPGHDLAVFTVAFSPDGSRLASASNDGSVRVWDVAARRHLCTLSAHRHCVEAVAFAADGRLLASKSLDDTVRLWDTGTWECVAVIDEKVSDIWRPALAFHPREPRLATLAEGDTAVRIWRLDMDPPPPAPAEADWFKPGDRLGGYEITHVHSRGSFSYNLEVRDWVGRLFHAVVHWRLDLSGESQDGLRLETSLSHPGLPFIPFIGAPSKESHDRVWFIREHLPLPLADSVARTGVPRPAQEILRVGQGVCRLFEYLHDPAHHGGRPHVHGFLVPGYIHLSERGDVKVAGMDVQVLVRAGQEVPTRHRSYRCPECLEAPVGGLTPANDLWALAGCLLFLATGQPPVDGSDVEAVRSAHAAGLPRQRAEQVEDRRLRAVLLRALDSEPQRRFADATAFRLALEAAERPLGPSGAATLPGLPEDHAFSAQSVVTFYPAPVAVPYRRFAAQKDHGLRLLALFAAAEALTRYLFTLAVSDLFRCLAQADAPAALPDVPAFEFLRKSSTKGLLLGEWAAALRAAADALAAWPDRLVQEVPRVGGKGSHLEKVLGEIIQQRNRCTHTDGTIAITGDEARDVLATLRPLLEEALYAARFICRYPLGFFQRLTAAGEKQPLFALHSCMGSRISNTAEAYQFQSAVPLPDGFPFVVAPTGAPLLLLWPLLLQRLSEISHRHTLYVFDRIPDRRRPWLASVLCSAIDARGDAWHKELHPEPPSDHGWLLRRLRELAVMELPTQLNLADWLLPTRGRLVGRCLGPYRLRQLVAVGGFGTIYLAEGEPGGRVAVKVLESGHAARQLERFDREFEKLRGVDHPGIIRCLEEGMEPIDGRSYKWYSMEFAVGGDLTGRLEERGGAPWDNEALRAAILQDFRDISEAVAHLHRLGIIHRDLKPSNVLIMGDGSLRLSDFGLVKNLEPSVSSLEGATSTGAVLGTPAYMAPEQRDGSEVGKQADVYALGIMLAEFATGQRPAANLDTRQGSTLNDFAPLNGVMQLRRFILRCTDVDWHQRPRDGDEMLRQFIALVESR